LSAKVSVIVPTYNRKSLLPETLDSILGQTYDNYEIVIVDDGSSDGTKEVIDKYIELNPDKIKYYYRNNGGCAAALNLGLDRVTGNYICVLGDDDIYEPGKLEIQAMILDKNPGIDFVYSDSYIFNGDERDRLLLTRVPRKTDNLAYDHFFNTNLFIPAMLFRKEIFSKLRFDESLRFNEDSDLTIRVALNYRGYYSNCPSLRIRKHRSQKSKNRWEITQALIRSYENIIRQYALVCRQLIGEPGVKRRMRDLYLEYAEACLMAERYQEITAIMDKIRPVPWPLYFSFKFRNNSVLNIYSLLKKAGDKLSVLLRRSLKYGGVSR